MKKLFVAGAVSVFIMGCNATSTSSTDIAANNQAKVADDSSGIICRQEKKVGSNRRVEVCTTAKERDEMRTAAREGWERSQGGSSTKSGSSNE